jgi:hypothetical protein
VEIAAFGDLQQRLTLVASGGGAEEQVWPVHRLCPPSPALALSGEPDEAATVGSSGAARQVVVGEGLYKGTTGGWTPR